MATFAEALMNSYRIAVVVGSLWRDFFKPKLASAIAYASQSYGSNSWAVRPAGLLGVSMLEQPAAFIRAKERLYDRNNGIAERSRPFFANLHG
jgi:hypothetical protein